MRAERAVIVARSDGVGSRPLNAIRDHACHCAIASPCNACRSPLAARADSEKAATFSGTIRFSSR